MWYFFLSQFVFVNEAKQIKGRPKFSVYRIELSELMLLLLLLCWFNTESNLIHFSVSCRFAAAFFSFFFFLMTFDVMKRNRYTMKELFFSSGCCPPWWNLENKWTGMNSCSVQIIQLLGWSNCVEALEVFFISFCFILRLWMISEEREFIKCADLNIWLVSVFIPATRHCPLVHMVWIFFLFPYLLDFHSLSLY